MRSVRCVNDANNQIVDDRYCVDEKPVNITNCAQHKCPKWRTGDWGQVGSKFLIQKDVILMFDHLTLVQS